MASQQNIISRSLPFAVYIVFLATSDYLANPLSTLGIDEKWLYAIKISAVTSLLIYFWHHYSELRVKPVIKHFLYAAIAGILVFLAWILPYPTWALLSKDTAAFNPMQGQNEVAVVMWLSIRLLGASLIVPVMEELFWRSFIMRWIDNKRFLSLPPEKVTTYALLASSSLFALEHQLWLAGLFAGLIYAWLYKSYKNLWIPIFAHGVTNGLLGVWVVYTGNWQYW